MLVEFPPTFYVHKLTLNQLQDAGDIMATGTCVYTYDGQQWTLLSDNSGPNCECPISHWGPPPSEDPPLPILTPAICDDQGENLPRFASLAPPGLDEAARVRDNEEKKTTCPKLYAIMELEVRKAMTKAGMTEKLNDTPPK